MDPRVTVKPVDPTIVLKGNKGKKPKHTTATSFVDQGTAMAHRAERETESFKVATVDPSVAKEIREARARKGWTQRQLATAVNEKVDVIKAVEGGKAPPNGALVVKLRRALKA